VATQVTPLLKVHFGLYLHKKVLMALMALMVPTALTLLCLDLLVLMALMALMVQVHTRLLLQTALLVQRQPG
jgi:hypothetical protein